jgi:ubiquinone/menaquinone biosynthesis C-methylase UbiE
MPANYNRSAAFYDRLSRVVFGDALIRAQVYLLTFIPPASQVLIIGGGTGWILDEITKIQPSRLNITYVELSENMIAMSRKRNVGNNQAEFINQAIEEVNAIASYDVLITPFLFDNYTDANLPAVFTHIHGMLKPGGRWLYTDFQLTGKWWQYAMLKSMLLFFKLLCGVESWHLPNVNIEFKRFGYNIIEEKEFFGKFVKSVVFTNH